MTMTSSKPCRLQQLEDVLHAGLADDRHHRLRLVRRERPQARTLAARHHDGLHAMQRSPGAAHVDDRGRDGAAEAEPEQPQRPARRIVRDDAEADARVQHPRGGLPEHVDVEVDASRREDAPAGEQQRGRARPRSRARPTAGVRRRRAGRSPRRSSAGRRAGRRSSRSATRRASARARKPSTWSVAPATPNRIPAGHVCASPAFTMSATNTGISDEPAEREGVRELGQRSGNRTGGHPATV